ncbi:pentapeptide repeat-containing protein [Aerosakkonema sp. BLCC-F183]|uniref:pentapeptide repeat-containing protein n=1 Tax=Aerosakkonema sp. BLCC-F183 TaxID=3342834 RepID=UPI0035B79630
MQEHSNEPRNYDVVLGGKTPPPTSGAVLGGLAGVKHRLISQEAEQRIGALMEALSYGEAGFDVLIRALDDPVPQVRDTACLLLQSRIAKITVLKKGVGIWNKWRASTIRLEGINVDLSSVNLSGFDLSGFNFSNANLIGANLSGANLSGANLSGANLSEANLIDADLTNANLTAACLWKAELNGAKLRQGTVLQQTTMPDGKVI